MKDLIAKMTSSEIKDLICALDHLDIATMKVCFAADCNCAKCAFRKTCNETRQLWIDCEVELGRREAK